MVAAILAVAVLYQESGIRPRGEKPVVGFPRRQLVPSNSMPSRPATSALLVVFGLAMGALLAPVPTLADTGGYSLMSWTDADGRALGAVYALAEDRHGYLWLGTDAGLFRFDGARFTAWNQLSDDPLPEGSVTALRVAADGSMWVGFDRAGVRRLSGARNIEIAAATTLDRVTDLVEDRAGTMWAVADGALHVLRHGAWQPVQLPWKDQPGRVLQPAVLADGALWVSTRWGVFRHTGEEDAFQLVSAGHTWGLTSDREAAVWTTDTVHGFRRMGAADV